jgi:hypothetical protein
MIQPRLATGGVAARPGSTATNNANTERGPTPNEELSA